MLSRRRTDLLPGLEGGPLAFIAIPFHKQIKLVRIDGTRRRDHEPLGRLEQGVPVHEVAPAVSRGLRSA